MAVAAGPDDVVVAEALRAELRAWLAAHLTEEVRAAATLTDDAGFETRRAWNASLFDAGWAAIAWPVAYGGRDAGLLEQLACHEEMALAGAPGPVNAIGVANIAPALLTHGTHAQQERFLRPMLRGDEIWSQGMSDPEAGSDLASLACRAVRDGEHFVVDGQKTWNSNGDRADWCQLFVRTDPDVPRHRGITCLLVDMRTPGVSVKPIITIDGSHEINDIVAAKKAGASGYVCKPVQPDVLADMVCDLLQSSDLIWLDDYTRAVRQG